MTTTMRIMLALCLVTLVLTLNASAQSPSPAAPSAATPEAQLLRASLEEQRALREEVRQLRTALQRISLNTYRAQMLIDRLARQQTRVDSLIEEIEQLKAQIQQALDATRDEDELKEIKLALDNAPDPQTRAELTRLYQLTERTQQRQREYARQEAERNQTRQRQLEATLHQEQAKLAEWQTQFDALDRELNQQAAEVRKAR